MSKSWPVDGRYLCNATKNIGSMSTRPSFEQNYQALGASGDSGHDRIQVWYDSLQARSYSVLRGGWTRWFFKRNEKRPDLVIMDVSGSKSRTNLEFWNGSSAQERPQYGFTITPSEYTRLSITMSQRLTNNTHTYRSDYLDTETAR